MHALTSFLLGIASTNIFYFAVYGRKLDVCVGSCHWHEDDYVVVPVLSLFVSVPYLRRYFYFDWVRIKIQIRYDA